MMNQDRDAATFRLCWWSPAHTSGIYMPGGQPSGAHQPSSARSSTHADTITGGL